MSTERRSDVVEELAKPWYMRESSYQLAKIEIDDQGRLVVPEVDEREIAEALFVVEGKVKVLLEEQRELNRRAREAEKRGAILAVVERDVAAPRLTEALGLAQLEVSKLKVGQLATALLRAKVAFFSVNQATEAKRRVLQAAQEEFDAAEKISQDAEHGVSEAAHAIDRARRAIDAEAERLGASPKTFDTITLRIVYAQQHGGTCANCGGVYARRQAFHAYRVAYEASAPKRPRGPETEVCGPCAVHIDQAAVARTDRFVSEEWSAMQAGR